MTILMPFRTCAIFAPILSESLDGVARHPSGFGHEGLAPVAERFGFGGRPEATAPLVQHCLQGPKLFSNDVFHVLLAHASMLSYMCYLHKLFADDSLLSPNRYQVPFEGR